MQYLGIWGVLKFQKHLSYFWNCWEKLKISVSTGSLKFFSLVVVLTVVILQEIGLSFPSASVNMMVMSSDVADFSWIIEQSLPSILLMCSISFFNSLNEDPIAENQTFNCTDTHSNLDWLLEEAFYSKELLTEITWKKQECIKSHMTKFLKLSLIMALWAVQKKYWFSQYFRYIISFMAIQEHFKNISILFKNISDVENITTIDSKVFLKSLISWNTNINKNKITKVLAYKIITRTYIKASVSKNIMSLKVVNKE